MQSDRRWHTYILEGEGLFEYRLTSAARKWVSGLLAISSVILGLAAFFGLFSNCGVGLLGLWIAVVGCFPLIDAMSSHVTYLAGRLYIVFIAACLIVVPFLIFVRQMQPVCFVG